MIADVNKVLPPAIPTPAAGRDDQPLPTEIAEYISDILAELREMADANGQAALSQLLDVARREALANPPPHRLPAIAG